MKLKINLGGILIGEELEYKEKVNIEINENGVMTHIGNGFDTQAIDLRNFILIPPLFNAHVHTADFTFPEIGIEKTINELVGDPKSEKYKYLKLLKDEIERGISEFLEKSVKFGVYGIVDFREEGVEGVKKSKKINMKSVHYFALGRLDKFNEEELKNLYDISDGYGLPSPSYHSKEELALIRNIFSNKIRAVHFAETKKQYLRDSLQDLISTYSPNLIIHGTQLGERDFGEIKDIPIVFCPRSNLWFGVGVPKIATAYDLGLTVLYGSDNGSWISPNLWKDLELALLITRIEKPGSNYARRILKSASIEAYKVFEVNHVIEEGKKIKPVLIKGDEIFRAKDVYTAIIKRGSDNGIYNLGAIQNIS